MTTVLTSLGSTFVRCVMRPSYATTWCLAMAWFADDGREADECRACDREVRWAVVRQTRTRDLKRGEAA